jgi:hypothetical protein
MVETGREVAMLTTLRTLPEGCLSDYRRDKLLARELSPDEERAARAHVAGCARCAERVREAEGDAARFAGEAPRWGEVAAAVAPERLPGVPELLRARRRRFLGLASAGMAAAAAAVLLLVVRGPAPPSSGTGAGASVGVEAGTRTKGRPRPRIGFFVKRGGAVWAGGPAETLRPGDAVRFTYSSDALRFLAIVGVDGKGQGHVLYPSAAKAARAPAGRQVALPESVVVGAVRGRERVLAVFCDRAIDVEPLQRAWLANLNGAAVPEGCTHDVLTWDQQDGPAP